MDPRHTAELLKSWALEAGFDLAGVARLEPAEHGEAYLEWLERGDHAGMEWMRRRPEVRLDPRRVLPGARSALCVALQYWPLEGEGDPHGILWRGVARYARGDDYHGLMERRLRRLGERVEEAFPGCRSRAYVDTGPVLERELAAQAGLGAIGKNTNLLHRELGSWLLLGELFLTLAVEPDPPVADLCGDCTACLDACPTGALPEAYRLDARRCISYWTIEHRGAVPQAMRAETRGWTFGCDICQLVCPYNAAPPAAEHPELRLPADRAELDLVRLLGLPAEEYRERFRRSPMKRARHDGLRRNAATVLGNRAGESEVAPLSGALEDGEPTVRRHAAWALGRIGGRRARCALAQQRNREMDPEVRDEIELALVAC